MAMWMIHSGRIIFLVFVPLSLFLVSVVGDETRRQLRQSNSIGLFKDSQSVYDLHGDSEWPKRLNDTQKPTILVFYASWCGHCQMFAPQFDKVAEKLKQRTIELNKEMQRRVEQFGLHLETDPTAFGGLRLFPEIDYVGLNCAEYSSLCAKFGIDRYPTIGGFNFPDSLSDHTIPMSTEGNLGEWYRLLDGIPDVMRFLSTAVFTNGELDGLNKPVTSSSAETSNTTMKAIYASHTATATSRLNDARQSLLYLLISELPGVIPREGILALKAATRVVSHPLTGSDENIDISFGSAFATVNPRTKKEGKVLELSARVFQKFMETERLVSGVKMGTLLLKHLQPNELNWETCGVNLNGTTPEVNDSGGILARLRGTKDEKAVKFNTHSQVQRGYTCGLWLLFHNLAHDATVKGGVEASRQAMLHIHTIVTNFFRCHGCRMHFVHYYDACWFGRCDIESGLVSVEWWLFRLHNLVNARLAIEHRVSGLDVYILMSDRKWIDANSGALADSFERSLWPSQAQCPSCYTQTPMQRREMFLSNLISIQENFKVGDTAGWEDVVRPILETTFREAEVSKYLIKAFDVSSDK